MKHTWQEHPDYESLVKASNKISEIADYLNTKKKEAENISMMIELQGKLTGKNIPVS